MHKVTPTSYSLLYKRNIKKEMSQTGRDKVMHFAVCSEVIMFYHKIIQRDSAKVLP